MALPKLLSPEFSVQLPSNKQPLSFRPFLVKEEKVLYMALEGGDPTDIQKAVLDVLGACILTPDIQISQLTSYDIEYLFLQLRSKSIGEEIEISLMHQDEEVRKACTHQQKIKINVNDIQIKFNKDHNDTIMITEEVGIKLKAPSLDVALKIDPNKPTLDTSMELLTSCIVNIFDKENVYEEYTRQEIDDFIESLTQEQFGKINKFFTTIPKLSHTITYKCDECGREETVTLEGLQSFFT